MAQRQPRVRDPSISLDGLFEHGLKPILVKLVFFVVGNFTTKGTKNTKEVCAAAAYELTMVPPLGCSTWPLMYEPSSLASST